MTTADRREAKRNLDAVNRSTEATAATEDLLEHRFAVELGLTGIGYALLDVADAIREHTRKAGR
jgi:hypothetical protein